MLKGKTVANILSKQGSKQRIYGAVIVEQHSLWPLFKQVVGFQTKQQQEIKIMGTARHIRYGLRLRMQLGFEGAARCRECMGRV